MRIFASLIMLFLATQCVAQTIVFEDPDLTFSIKKPKKWQVFDDGYVVKLSPSVSDSATLYVSLTYFEAPKVYDLFDSFEGDSKETEEKTVRLKKLDVSQEDTSTDDLIKSKYTFRVFGQEFLIRTSAPAPLRPKQRKVFRKIVRSVRIAG